MIPNGGGLSLEERKAMAASLSQQLVTEIRRNEMRPAEDMTLFGIEQHTVDLLLFRQDCMERISALAAGDATELAVEERAEIQAELEACDLELAKLAGQEIAKVDSCANLLRMCDRMEAHCKDERDRQARKAKRWATIRESVENVVMEALTLANRTSFDSPTNRLRVQRNGQPRVEFTEPNAVQDRFLNVVVQFPMDVWKKIKTALPDLLPSQYVVKDQNFNTGAIAKVLKAAEMKKQQQAEDLKSGKLPSEKIETVKGAELRYGKHLRCE